MAINPNWPLFDEAISFDSGPQAFTAGTGANTTVAGPPQHWCSMIGRTEGSWTCQRGRQYELDQVQASTGQTTLNNLDGALDPSNTSSPFYPGVRMFRAYRRRAMWPRSVNLLTQDQATGRFTALGALSGYTSMPDWVIASNVATVSVALTHAGTVNQNDYQITYTGAAADFGITFTGMSILPGQEYTFSFYVISVSGTAVPIQATLYWSNPLDGGGSVVTSVSSAAVTPNGVYQRVTVTATAPASNAAGAFIVIQNTTSVSGTWVCGINRAQWEEGASASAYTDPGVWYDLLNGYVGSWPQSWNDNGTYGVSNLSLTDAFGYLSQHPMKAPGYQESIAAGVGGAAVQCLYPLDEASGATTFADLLGVNDVATTVLGGTAVASQCAPGTTLQGYVSPVTGAQVVPEGIPGPVVHFNNSGDPAIIRLPTNLGAAWLSNGGGVTRHIAFRNTGSPSGGFGPLWWLTLSSGTIKVDYEPGPSEQVRITVVQNTTTTYTHTFTIGGTSNDAWHLLSFSVDQTGKNWQMWVDGVNVDTTNLASDGRPNSLLAGTVADEVGGPLSSSTFIGDVAFVGQIGMQLTSAQQQQLWRSFYYASGTGPTGATSGDRFADILRWALWAGESSVDVGRTQTYGPSSDLNATSADSGTDAVSALQTVVDTENGSMFVSKAGAITFKDRASRYNQTAVLTFGEDTAAGEIPYTNVVPAFDPARLANDVQINQPSTGVTYRKIDTGSIGEYGSIQLQRTVNSVDVNEIDAARDYLLARYKEPSQRIDSITIDVAATNSWTSILPLELGALVKVNRRPPSPAPMLSFTGFIEQINWNIDDAGNATVTFQLSPEGVADAWELDSATYSVLDSTTIIAY